MILGYIVSKIGKLLFKRQWRKQNSQNDTYPSNIFPIENIQIGKATYGNLFVRVHKGSPYKLIIGNYCSIANETVFILHDEHHVDTVSTFPFKNHVLKENEPEAFSKGNIVIDDDVWIGYRCMILSGVHIGQGAVIAAGAVVTKDIPPYAIAGGVPARVIKYRFSKVIVDELMKMDYDNLSYEDISKNIGELYLHLESKEQVFELSQKLNCGKTNRK